MAAGRYFTVGEANRLVPFLERAMARLQERYGEARDAHREMQLCKAVGHGPDGRLIMAVDYEAAHRRFEQAVQAMKAVIDDVHGRGCQIKDIHLGLVDFPARIDGDEVLLCWKLGEPAVLYYHRPEDGYAGRRPIPPAYLPPALPHRPSESG